MPAQLTRPSRHRTWWTATVVAGLAALTFATGLAGHATVTSPSMAPTHDVGSTLLTTTLGARHPDRGDVVVFAMPRGWHDAERERAGDGAPVGQDAMVKRVIGLPGDRVTCCAPGGALVRNGGVLAEPYLAEAPDELLNTTYDVTVPAGHVWVLGDNRRRSFDSRAMHARSGESGFLPISAIRSRVLLGLP